MMGLLKRRKQPMYRPGAAVRPRPGVSAAERDGRTVLLDLKGERYYGLDEVGGRLWTAFAAGATARAAAEALADEYDAPLATLIADAEAFASRLVDAGLLEVV